MPRTYWTQYFMKIAHEVATRGTCDRKRVGCVLTIDHHIVSTGYNGSIPGHPHCDDVGHDLVETLDDRGVPRPNCVRTIHAEANAIVQAAKRGSRLEGATAYINTFPCWPCFRLLAGVGVRHIWFDDEYRPDERVKRAAELSKISLNKFNG